MFARMLRRLWLLRRNRWRLAYLLAAATVILLMLALGQPNAFPFRNWGAIPGIVFVVAGIGLAAFLTHRGLLGGGRGIGPHNAAEVMRTALQHVKLLAFYIAVSTVGLLSCYPGVSDDVVRALLSPTRAGTPAAAPAAVAVPPARDDAGGQPVNSEPYRAAVAARVAAVTRQATPLPGDALGDYYYRYATRQLAQRLPPRTAPEARRQEIRAYLIGAGTALTQAAGSPATAPGQTTPVQTAPGQAAAGQAAAVVNVPTINGSSSAYQAFWQGVMQAASAPANPATGGGVGTIGGGEDIVRGGVYEPAREVITAKAAGELFAALLLALDDKLDILISRIINTGRCIDWIQALGTLPPGMTPGLLMQQYSTQPGSTVAPIIAAMLRGTGGNSGSTAGSGTTGGGTTSGGTTGDTVAWPAIEAEILRIYRTNYSEASHRRELMDSYRRADGGNVAWLEQHLADMTPTERAAFERAAAIAAQDGGPPLDARYLAYSGMDTAALRELYRQYRNGL